MSFRHSEIDLFELLSEIDELTEVASIQKVLATMLDSYGLRSVAYLGADLAGGRGQSPYLAVTYSNEWIDRYKAERFIEIDPTIQIGLRRMLPVDWTEFDRDDVKVRRLFGEASEFGLGSQGISLPVHGRHGDRALLSITSDVPSRDWQHLRYQYLRDFHLVALHLHQAILRLEGGKTAERPVLSPRERECLRWISEGKTSWECGMILGLSERTVRFYLESARHKLGAANTTHAVAKADKARLLSELP